MELRTRTAKEVAALRSIVQFALNGEPERRMLWNSVHVKVYASCVSVLKVFTPLMQMQIFKRMTEREKCKHAVSSAGTIISISWLSPRVLDLSKRWLRHPTKFKQDTSLITQNV